jgi:hypothetical protein
MNKYVYVILDITKNKNVKYGKYEFSHQPIYVGYGNYNRWDSHFVKAKRGDTRTHIRAKIKKLADGGNMPKVEIIYIGLKHKAVKLEIELISVIGRKIFGDGPLYNITNGGDGGSTYTGNPNIKNIIKKLKKRKVWNKGMTKETSTGLMKLSETMKNKIKLGQLLVPSRAGVILEKQIREKISKSRKGKKLLIPRKDAKIYKFTDNVGKVFELIGQKKFDIFLKEKYPQSSRYKLLNNCVPNCKLEIIQPPQFL